MAYFLKQNEDENNNLNQNQNAGGNIYSTSGGEVSSQTENDTPTSNSKTSNSSGNWVNLTSYLDANQNKAGRYANSFVEDDLNKSSEYKNNLQNAQNSYLNSIKNDDAYRYSQGTAKGNLVFLPNNDQKVKNFINDSSSLSSNDKNLIMNTIKGYQGDKNFATTGDKYGYNQLRSDSDYFNNQSQNITNDNYLRSVMGNNISSGGKNLNSFILAGSKDAQNTLNNAKQNYIDAYNSFYDTLNNLDSEYSKVFSEANKNTTNARNAATSEKARIEAEINDQYNKNKAFYDQQKQSRAANPLGYADPLYKQGGFYSDYGWDIYQVKDDLSDQAKSNRDKEIQELNQRYNYLLGKISDPGSSKIDYNFAFEGNYRNPTQAEIEQQVNRSRNFFRNISTPKYTYSEESQPILDQIERAYVQGRINDQQASEYVSQLKKGKLPRTSGGLGNRY